MVFLVATVSFLAKNLTSFLIVEIFIEGYMFTIIFLVSGITCYKLIRVQLFVYLKVTIILLLVNRIKNHHPFTFRFSCG